MSDASSHLGPRLATAAALVAWAIALALGETAALPQWLIGVAAAAGIDPSTAMRLLVGVLVASAGTIVVLGPRGRVLARLAAVGLVFNAIAQAAHLWRRDADAAGGWWLVLATGLVGLILLSWPGRGAPSPTRGPRARPGLVGTGVAAALLLGAGIAANLDLVVPIDLVEGRTYSGTRVVEDLTTETWVDLPLEETGLLEHLPQVGPLAERQSTLITFYRPECGSCHAFFDESLGDSPPARTIAIRVPPAEGVDVVETDHPREIACDGCIRLALPEGPVWIVETPVALVVEDGVVTCVATEDFDRCLDRVRPEGKPAPQSASPST